MNVDSSRITDAKLIEILGQGETGDANEALLALQARYSSKIEAFVKSAVPEGWVEDVVQEVWLAFYLAAREGRIENPGAYLSGIARNIRADAADRVKREREIEEDVEVVESISPSAEEELHRQQEWIRQHFQVEVATLAPFAARFLASCEIPIYTLNAVNQYSGRIVSKLLGKRRDNIYAQVRKARKRVYDYLSSPQFEMLYRTHELPDALQFERHPEAQVVIEFFSEPSTPKFSEDELKPLGLGPQELGEHYISMMLVPRWYEQQTLATNEPSLLLLRKSEWEKQRLLLQRLRSNQEDWQYFSPEIALINFKVDNDQIVLKPEGLFELGPDSQPEYSDDMFLAVHEPRLTTPAIFGFLDESLLDEKALERWPFIQSGDWYDFG